MLYMGGRSGEWAGLLSGPTVERPALTPRRSCPVRHIAPVAVWGLQPTQCDNATVTTVASSQRDGLEPLRCPDRGVDGASVIQVRFAGGAGGSWRAGWLRGRGRGIWRRGWMWAGRVGGWG